MSMGLRIGKLTLKGSMDVKQRTDSSFLISNAITWMNETVVFEQFLRWVGSNVNRPYCRRSYNLTKLNVHRWSTDPC